MGVLLRLDLPEGFEAAATFRGFVDPRRGATISVNEAPGLLAPLVAAWTPERVARAGLTWVACDPASQPPLLTVDQFHGPGRMRKWTAAYAGPATTALVTAACPASVLAQEGEAMLAAVTSAECRWHDSLADDQPLASPVEGLTFAARSGDQVFFTGSGRLPAQTVGEPRVCCTTLHDPIAADQTVRLVKGRAAARASFEVTRVMSEQTLHVDGAVGYEIISVRSVPASAHMTAVLAAVAWPAHAVVIEGCADARYARWFVPAVQRFVRALRRTSPHDATPTD